MKDIIIDKVNETYIRINASEGVLTHIYKAFSFTNNKLKHHPLVKARRWDGYIHLLNMRTCLMYIGLMEELVYFFKENDYSFGFTFTKENAYNPIVLEQTRLLLEDRFILHEHQEKAIQFALKTNRGVIISATGSGKSLIMYMLSMYYLLNGQRKILIVSPRTQLVEQTAQAFLEYHKGDKRALEENFELKYSGSDRNPDANFTFTTWQSLLNESKLYLEQFEVVLWDEAHGVKSKSLTDIMEKCINAKHKFGFTGTLSNENDDSEVDELVLKGLFGKKEVVSTNKELIDKNILVKCNINVIRLKYMDKSLCSLIIKGSIDTIEISDYTTKRKKIFNDEQEYIINSKLRNKFITELALTRHGNTLLMFQYVEKQGKLLYNILQEMAPKYGKEIYYIHGGISVEKREEIRQLVESKNNIIVVSSYGTTSTGIDFKNICNIIFASAFKSKITMKQTIGRGLRTHINKEELNVYDIGDDFSFGKKKKNFLFTHFMERVKIYKDERFPVKLVEYEILNDVIKKVI